MTVALAVIFVGVLLGYCAIKGRSFKDAIVGRSVLGAQGSIVTPA